MPATSTPHGTATLTLTINGTPYLLRKLDCESHAAEVCYTVRKRGQEAYHVSQHAYGCQCTCGDFEFRRNHLDPEGCKHVKALVAVGLIRNRPAPVRGGAPAEAPFPKRVRDGMGPVRATAANEGPGLNTWRGGHEA